MVLTSTYFPQTGQLPIDLKVSCQMWSKPLAAQHDDIRGWSCLCSPCLAVSALFPRPTSTKSIQHQIWSIATSEFFNFLKTAGIYACIFSAKFWLHVSLSLQMAQPVWKQTAATISLRRQWRDSSASLCYSDKGNKDWIWTFVYDGKSSSDGRNITAHGSNTEYTEDTLAKGTIQRYCHFLQSLRNMNNGAPAVAGSRYHSSPVTWISCRNAHFASNGKNSCWGFGFPASLQIWHFGVP